MVVVNFAFSSTSANFSFWISSSATVLSTAGHCKFKPQLNRNNHECHDVYASSSNTSIIKFKIKPTHNVILAEARLVVSFCMSNYIHVASINIEKLGRPGDEEPISKKLWFNGFMLVVTVPIHLVNYCANRS